MEEGAWQRSSLQQELGRAERKASLPDSPTTPWQAAVLGTRALEGKARQLREAASRCSAEGDTRIRARGPSFCVGLELTSHISGWLRPWGCGFGPPGTSTLKVSAFERRRCGP